MKGTVKKEGNSWYYRVYIGTDELTHKKKYKKKRGFKTKKEAESALNKLIYELEQGTNIDNDNMTVKQYMEYFNNQYVKKNCAPSTVRRYGFSINDINEYLGNVKLNKLNPLMVQQFYDDVIEDKGQSQNTLLKTHRTLHLALQCALKWRLVNTNVCDLVIKPKPVKKEIEYWSHNMVKSYLEEIDNELFYPLAFMSCHTGLRIGELCALKWKHIDLDNKLLYVNETRSIDKDGALYDGPTKNKKKRVITLFDTTIDFLKDIKPTDNKVINITSKGKEDNRYVFTYSDGRPIDPHYISQKFANYIKEKDKIKEKITFHGLRHTHATMLLAAGVNIKVISERLGHSTVAFTMDTYVHSNQELQKQEMKKASNLF